MPEGKEMLLVVSKLKAEVKAAGMRSGDDFINAVNDQVHLIIAASVKRCKEANRVILQPDDI